MELIDLLNNLTDKEKDFLFCEQAKGKELKVIDGKVVAVERVITDKEKAEARVAELTLLLKNTDYQAIKFFEGWLTDLTYQPIKDQRQAWRDEINALEVKYAINTEQFEERV